MSIIPAFQVGLWNAWILILPIITISFLGSKIIGKRETEESSNVNRKGKTLSNIYFAFVLLSYAYSIFLPLKPRTVWFAIGLLIYLPSICFVSIGLRNYFTTPKDQLVTKGVYRISRNPSYVSAVLIDLGIGIACLSWVFLLVAIIELLLLRYYVVFFEEPFLIEKYGDTYQEYINRTARWIGLPKSDK